MEKVNNIVIKVGALIVTSIVTIIFAISWLAFIPFCIMIDLGQLFVEIVVYGDDDHLIEAHNHIARMFINMCSYIKDTYYKLIDSNNFNQLIVLQYNGSTADFGSASRSSNLRKTTNKGRINGYTLISVIGIIFGDSPIIGYSRDDR